MNVTTRSFGLTDVGRQRMHNEDGFLASPEDDVYAVVDGMGGASTGDIATSIALQALTEGYRASREIGEARLGAAVQLANRRIYDRAERENYCRGMGAAIAALAVSRGADGAAVHLAHVGDSRIYRYRRLELAAMTRDHSLINEYMLYKPDLTPEEVEQLPKNVITRALGMREEVEISGTTHAARPGDLYLLCTDGIHAEIDDDVIASILRAHVDLPAAGRALVSAALEHGGHDNIACVLVQLGVG